MQLNISLDSAEVNKAINALPRDIFRAQRSAEFETVRFATRELRNRAALRTGIPSRVFRRFKGGRVKSRNNQQAGIVWFGLNPVKAAYLGKLQQTRSGAKAGAFFFERAFVATMKSGHKSLWRRLGRDRLPLKEMEQDLDIGYEIADDVAALAGIQLRARFAEKVRQLNPHLV